MRLLFFWMQPYFYAGWFVGYAGDFIMQWCNKELDFIILVMSHQGMECDRSFQLQPWHNTFTHNNIWPRITFCLSLCSRQQNKTAQVQVVPGGKFCKTWFYLCIFYQLKAGKMGEHNDFSFKSCNAMKFSKSWRYNFGTIWKKISPQKCLH